MIRCSWSGGALAEGQGMVLMSADRNVAITLECDQAPRAGCTARFPARCRFPQSVAGWNIRAFYPGRSSARSMESGVPDIAIACLPAGGRQRIVGSGCAVHSGRAPSGMGTVPVRLCRERQCRPIADSEPNRFCYAHRFATRWRGFQVVRWRSMRVTALTVGARHAQRFR